MRLLFVALAALVLAAPAWAPPNADGVWLIEDGQVVCGGEYTEATGEIEIAGEATIVSSKDETRIAVTWPGTHYVVTRIQTGGANGQ